MTPEYILRKSLCRPAYCGDYTTERRLSEIECMGYASDYGEPGYSKPEKGILFANWNLFPRNVDELLKGYEIEWSDEWTQCYDCGLALRISPDSYCWQPSKFDTDDGTYCKDCIDMEAYLESLEGNPRRALNDHINPADYGYVKLEENFENGWHPGQNDNPCDIYERLMEQGRKRLLFNVDEVSQFYIVFSVWEKQVD